MSKALTASVAIIIDGEEYELRSSMKIASAISNRFGGFTQALNALIAQDLASYQFIIRQGVPLKLISTDELNEAVWRTGMRKLSQQLSKYISVLQNGGRDPDDTDTDDVDEGDEGNGKDES